MFPIDVAEARIRLPGAVKFGQRAVLTHGPQGSTASNAEVVDERPGDITFRTTQPLGPYEGLTVAVAFPKGVVADLSEGERAGNWLADYGSAAGRAAWPPGLIAFYYIAWKRAGRDPRAGTVVPIFAPPDDLSPAGMRYVVKMNADNRAFAAALVDMGVRGHIKDVRRRRRLVLGQDPVDRAARQSNAASGGRGGCPSQTRFDQRDRRDEAEEPRKIFQREQRFYQPF
jgi:hypothetical protein